MGRGLRAFGHPVHAAIVHVPMGLLAMTPLWDALGALRAEGVFFAVATWTIAAGLAVGLLAAVAGSIDLAALDEGSPAERPALIHAGLMVTALSLYGASLVFRHGAAPLDGGVLVATLSCDGLGLFSLGLGGWFGGELVFRHGVGRRADA